MRTGRGGIWSQSAFWCAAALYLLMLAWVGRYPVYDEIAFKSPGLQLALANGFRSPELEHFVVPLSVSPAEVYGLQPPGYPLAFAAWTALVGYGWSQGFLFDGAIHIALCFLTARFAIALHAGAASVAWQFAIVLIPVGTVGRPDELAMSLLLLAGILALVPGILASVASAMLIALAVFTSPGAVAAFALLAFGVVAIGPFRERLPLGRVVRVSSLAVIAALIVLVIVARIWPLAVEQFREHSASLGSHRSVWARAHHWLRFAAPPFTLGAGMIVASIALALFVTIASARSHWRVLAIMVWLAATVIVVGATFHSPFYLWFTLPASGAIGLAACRALSEKWSFAFLIAWVVISVPALATAGADWFSLCFLPAEQRLPEAGARVKRLLPPGARVLTDEHWMSLVGHARVFDAGFPSKDVLDHVDFVVLTGNRSGAPHRRRSLPPSLEAKLTKEFTVADDQLSGYVPSVFGVPLSRSARGFGAVILRRAE